MSDPKTSDYCSKCGESPDSGSHWVGPNQHEYVAPKVREPFVGVFYTGTREGERAATHARRAGAMLVGERFDAIVVRCTARDFLDPEFCDWLTYLSCRRTSFVPGHVSPYTIEVA